MLQPNPLTPAPAPARPRRLELYVNPRLRVVWYRDRAVRVSPAVAYLLHALAEAHPAIVPLDRLADSVFADGRRPADPVGILLQRARLSCRSKSCRRRAGPCRPG